MHVKIELEAKHRRLRGVPPQLEQSDDRTREVAQQYGWEEHLSPAALGFSRAPGVKRDSCGASPRPRGAPLSEPTPRVRLAPRRVTGEHVVSQVHAGSPAEEAGVYEALARFHTNSFRLHNGVHDDSAAFTCSGLYSFIARMIRRTTRTPSRPR